MSNLVNPQLVADVAAVLLGVSKLFSSAKTLWDKLPRPVAVALPVVVASLPVLADTVGLVKTDVDLVNWVIVSVALLVPGVAEAVSKSDEPTG